MIKVGMMIADRYEIIEKIGTGGMSDVYRAKCHKLNRFVAVKVLKQEFSENSDFVSKFRVEAQAAAGLMHPNIVNVYDVGEENGFHYIVMELVEGITLKKYIEKKARLSVKEAVSIAIQVSMGIEAAHNNHIIHRDIKPQNIIISRDGKVKVTDFGIAKAATSNTITSNVMGSVHYTSPEQVRGGFSDEKSDIYSLGITLFEMLTGRVPFNGETTVAVAIKHIQEQMPSPRDFVPEIPISVEQIVLKCTQKSPDRRYQYAPELIEDLKKSLISPDENFVKMNEVAGGETINVSQAISKKDLEQIKKSTDQRDQYEQTIEQTTGPMKGNGANRSTGPMRPAETVKDEVENIDKRKTVRRPAQPAVPVTPETTEYYPPEQEEEYIDEYEAVEQPKKTAPKKPAQKKNTGNKNSKSSSVSKPAKTTNKKTSTKKSSSSSDEYNPKTEFFTTVLVVVAAVIIGCVFLYIVGKALGVNLIPELGASQEEVVEVSMVNVAGLDADAAYNQLTNMGLKVLKVYQESADIEGNKVIGASIPEGTMVATGTEVTIFISSGLDGAQVPNVVGLSRAEAIVLLDNEFYKYNITTATSDTVAKDNVISQSPAGGSVVPPGATIDVVVSLGQEVVPVTVPNVVGQTESEAKRILEENGLSGAVLKSEYNSSVAEGLISYQSYTAGATVNSGTEVELHLSLGVEQIYYSCVMQVSAPSDYAGGDAQVVLKGSDGSQLFATTTSSFPVDININGIFGISAGELWITYNINQPQEVTDSDGNVTVQNVQVSQQYGPQSVVFTRM